MESISETLQGFQASLLPEVERYWVENPRFAYTPEQPPQVAKPKRVQVGWIEERWGNKQREKQSLSLYYCYYASEWELNGEGSTKKQRIYLQAHQCQEISAMVHHKRPYTEILEAIGRTKRHSDRPHHMQEPKI